MMSGMLGNKLPHGEIKQKIFPALLIQVSAIKGKHEVREPDSS